LANSTARAEWVATQVDDVVQKGLDGFNFDFEDPLDPDSPESQGYTSLVKELREALMTALPAAQVPHI
jgi:spore germination protein YaaH